MNEARGERVLELDCHVNASPDRVFALLTEPAGLAMWWGPYGFTTPDVELDLRVGGRYRFSMQPPDGGLFHLSGEFLEIDPPRRLVYTFRWEEPTPDDQETVASLSIEENASGTDIHLTHGPFRTDERLALHRRGWTEAFDKLRRAVDREVS